MGPLPVKSAMHSHRVHESHEAFSIEVRTHIRRLSDAAAGYRAVPVG